ncbi:MAG: 3-phosphoglycerate dehydrogenase [Rhodobiaceae bacterium]|nr:3-phosphoglycerate dehydrogenase [Rhodobiaceae bacterium]
MENMYKIIVGGKIHQKGIDLLEKVENFEVLVLPDASQETLENNISDADAILLRLQSFTKSMIDKSLKLKILSRNGVGYDRIDIPALTNKKIPLTIVGDVNSGSVAEHTIMFILDLLKNTKRHDHMIRSNNWKDRDLLISNDFEGKKILIVGFGKIGQKVAGIAHAFNAKINIYDPYIKNRESYKQSYTFFDELNLAFGESEIITLHAPGSKKPIIGRDEIKLMQPDTILVNTSRGSHIDLDALLDALRSGQIRGAGLDVYPEEPPDISKHEIFNHENILFSPHIAGLNNDCAARMAINSAQNIIDYFSGKLKPEFTINKEIL